MSRIFVVEENRLGRDFMVSALAAHGHRVGSAASGSEAQVILKRRRFDLVLLDLELPDADGIEILLSIRASRANGEIPVIVITEKHDHDKILQAIDAGAIDHLVRPFGVRMLDTAVERALALEPGQMESRRAALAKRVETFADVSRLSDEARLLSRRRRRR